MKTISTVIVCLFLAACGTNTETTEVVTQDYVEACEDAGGYVPWQMERRKCYHKVTFKEIIIN